MGPLTKSFRIEVPVAVSELPPTNYTPAAIPAADMAGLYPSITHSLPKYSSSLYSSTIPSKVAANSDEAKPENPFSPSLAPPVSGLMELLKPDSPYLLHVQPATDPVYCYPPIQPPSSW